MIPKQKCLVNVYLSIQTVIPVPVLCHRDKKWIPSEILACNGVCLCSPVALSANTIYDGDKEYECEEDAPNPEDSRKVRLLKCDDSGTLFSAV